MRPLHGVLLDIDDTLLDTTGAMLRAGSLALAAVWPSATTALLEQASLRYRVDPGGYFGEYTAGRLEFAAMRQARLAEVAQHFALSHPAGAYETFEAAYTPAFVDSQRVFEDVPRFLKRCRAAGWALGALTNSSTSATELKLQATELDEFFDVVVTRDTLGFGKPDARVFAHACDRIGSSATQTVYVGDERAADAIGARDAGMQSWWLQRPVKDHQLSAHVHGERTERTPVGVSTASSLDEVAAALFA